MSLLWAASLSIATTAAMIPGFDQLLNSNQFDVFDKPVDDRPEINTDHLQSLIKPEALETWANKLWNAANTSTPEIGHPTRAIGTPGHNATLELIFDTLDELSDYYTFEAQPFVALGGRVHNWSLADSKGSTIDSKPLRMSPPINTTVGKIHHIPNFGCLPSDYYNSDGRVAVVKRGSCAFGDKAEMAGLAGAKAVLLWDPEADNVSAIFDGGDLGLPLGHQVATLGISAETALSLKKDDEVKVYVDSEVLQIDTVNVIAETKEGDHDNVVFAGAHSDSVLEGPGINDNGSGLITLLEVAKQLTKFRVNNAIRLAWWSAEELGLKGSLYYADNLPQNEAKKIRLFLDYDMLASQNYAYEIYDSDDSENPKGSSALRDMYKQWYEDHGYEYVMQPFDGRSDYVGFIEIGIPASGVDSGVEEIKSHEEKLKFGGTEGIAFDPCYHLACDDLGNVNYEPWLVNSKLVAHSVANYATSLEGFPVHDTAFYKQRVTKPRKWSYNNLA